VTFEKSTFQPPLNVEEFGLWVFKFSGCTLISRTPSVLCRTRFLMQITVLGFSSLYATWRSENFYRACFHVHVHVHVHIDDHLHVFTTFVYVYMYIQTHIYVHCIVYRCRCTKYCEIFSELISCSTGISFEIPYIYLMLCMCSLITKLIYGSGARILKDFQMTGGLKL
jgi:hypothetical protein